MNPGSPPRPFSNIENCPPAPKLGYKEMYDHSTKEWKLVKTQENKQIFQQNNFNIN